MLYDCKVIKQLCILLVAFTLTLLYEGKFHKRYVPTEQSAVLVRRFQDGNMTRT